MRRLIERLHPHAEELGSADDLDGLEDLLEHGNGATRQQVVYEANHDLREVVGEIIAATVPTEQPRRPAAEAAEAARLDARGGNLEP